MSAWDITGAVWWSALTVFFTAAILAPSTNGSGKIICFVIVCGSAFAAIFCIARLFGAHL